MLFCKWKIFFRNHDILVDQAIRNCKLAVHTVNSYSGLRVYETLQQQITSIILRINCN